MSGVVASLFLQIHPTILFHTKILYFLTTVRDGGGRLLAGGAGPHVLLGQGDGKVARREEEGRRRVEQGKL